MNEVKNYKGYASLAVIPARGGSKGVPRKNIKNLLGKPLIAYTIEQAKRSKLLSRFIVSTDDEEIAAVARQYGAEVPFLRPKEISGDNSTDVEFLEHAVNWLKENEGYEPDIILRLPPTSPLRRAEHIDTGIKTLVNGGEKLDAARPVVESPKHPYKMWKISGITIEPLFPDSVTGMKEPWNLPRQKLPKIHVHTGAMDVLWRKTLTEQKSTSGTRLGYFFMEPECSINIDSELDFMMAELLLSRERRNV